MKYSLRRALTVTLVTTLSLCVGMIPGVGAVSGGVNAKAAGGSASSIFAGSIKDLPVSDAASQTAKASVGGVLGRRPDISGKIANVASFGAKGDDRSSDTEAIQKAINSLGGAGTVLFPAGTFYCAEIKVPSNVSLVSMTTFGFDGGGATQLLRNKPKASCILDLTGAQNVTISGISIEGMGASAQAALTGIRVVNAKNIDIAGGRIDTGYKGPAVYVENSANVTVRSAMLCNSSYGVEAVSGQNLLVVDCWLTSCHPAGYYGHGSVKNVRITANRIEWCGTGTLMENVNDHSLVGNYYDRCSIGGIRATGGSNIRMLGNINQRNGVNKGTDESCNLYLNGVSGAVYRGNVMEAIRGDGVDQNVTPETAMILRSLKNSQITYNAAYKGFTKELLKDYGGHSGATISNNVGTRY